MELATAPEAMSAVESLLRSLGFHEAGRHRSKAVQLWRQNGLCVLTNSEPSAAASGRPGPALAAIGVETEDQLRSANRAEAFLARVQPRRRGPGDP